MGHDSESGNREPRSADFFGFLLSRLQIMEREAGVVLSVLNNHVGLGPFARSLDLFR
jgi:hypothetical protein